MSPGKEEALARRLRQLGIRESDIAEHFVRSHGPGGQNVNKASTCVYLKHIPTGIEVKCQKERSQALNRYLARKILANKIEAVIRQELFRAQQHAETLRRSSRRRSQKAKLKILEEKRRQARKKNLRQKVGETE